MSNTAGEIDDDALAAQHGVLLVPTSGGGTLAQQHGETAAHRPLGAMPTPAPLYRVTPAPDAPRRLILLGG